MAAGRTIRRWTAREVLSCPLAAGLCLKADRARGGWRVKSRGRWERGHQKKSEGASLQGEMACPDSPRTKIPAQRGFSEVMRIIHHLQWQHRKDYARAKEYFQKGLAIARDMGNRERICTLLANLGTLAREE